MAVSIAASLLITERVKSPGQALVYIPANRTPGDEWVSRAGSSLLSTRTGASAASIKQNRKHLYLLSVPSGINPAISPPKQVVVDPNKKCVFKYYLLQISPLWLSHALDFTDSLGQT